MKKKCEQSVLQYILDTEERIGTENILLKNAADVLVDDLRIKELPVSTRIRNTLRRAGFCWAKEILDMDFQEFFKTEKLGKNMMDELCTGLKDILVVCSDEAEYINRKSVGDTLYSQKLSVLDQVKALKDGVEKEAVLCCLRGMSVKETQEMLGVSVHTVRKARINILLGIENALEDDLKHWYRTYDFQEKDFKYIFQIGEESYNYLKFVCEKGYKEPMDILQDDMLTDEIKKRALETMQNKYLFMGNRLLEVDKEMILKEVAKGFSEKPVTIGELYSTYISFVKEKKLESHKKLFYATEDSFREYVTSKNYFLYSGNNMIRYYEAEKYDIKELFSRMNWGLVTMDSQSVKLLFDGNQKLMEEYGIMEPRELHNLMKKNKVVLMEYHVIMEKMPHYRITSCLNF